MIAAAHAGADAVDVAMDAMAGTTSQPSMGAFASSLARSPLDTGLDMDEITKVGARGFGRSAAGGVYAPLHLGGYVGVVLVRLGVRLIYGLWDSPLVLHSGGQGFRACCGEVGRERGWADGRGHLGLLLFLVGWYS